MTNEIQ